MKRLTLMLAVLAAFSIAGSDDLLAESKDKARRPNILFAIADDWSFGHAGAYGCAGCRLRTSIESRKKESSSRERTRPMRSVLRRERSS